MKSYMVKETIQHYHKLSIDDDMDFLFVLNQIRREQKQYSEDMATACNDLKLENVEFYENYCGIESVEIEGIEEI